MFYKKECNFSRLFIKKNKRKRKKNERKENCFKYVFNYI